MKEMVKMEFKGGILIAWIANIKGIKCLVVSLDSFRSNNKGSPGVNMDEGPILR
jgi:hypothetical protein